MFDNVGQKIQKISKIIFGACVVFGILIGIRAWSVFANNDKGGLGFVIFLLIVIFGSCSAWISQLMVQAYGKITESCELQIESFSQSKADTAKTIRKNQDAISTIVNPQANADGSWICSCGRKNSSYVSSCMCGKNKRDVFQDAISTIVNPQANAGGSWICSCGRKNSSYVSSCVCGKNKRDVFMGKMSKQ